MRAQRQCKCAKDRRIPHLFWLLSILVSPTAPLSPCNSIETFASVPAPRRSDVLTCASVPREHHQLIRCTAAAELIALKTSRALGPHGDDVVDERVGVEGVPDAVAVPVGRQEVREAVLLVDPVVEGEDQGLPGVGVRHLC